MKHEDKIDFKFDFLFLVYCLFLALNLTKFEQLQIHYCLLIVNIGQPNNAAGSRNMQSDDLLGL